MDWRNSDNKEKDGGRMENEANKKDEGTKKEGIHIYIYIYCKKWSVAITRSCSTLLSYLFKNFFSLIGIKMYIQRI